MYVQLTQESLRAPNKAWPRGLGQGLRPIPRNEPWGSGLEPRNPGVLIFFFSGAVLILFDRSTSQAKFVLAD
jgi:hypothetical protein